MIEDSCTSTSMQPSDFRNEAASVGNVSNKHCNGTRRTSPTSQEESTNRQKKEDWHGAESGIEPETCHIHVHAEGVTRSDNHTTRPFSRKLLDHLALRNFQLMAIYEVSKRCALRNRSLACPLLPKLPWQASPKARVTILCRLRQEC